MVDVLFTHYQSRNIALNGTCLFYNVRVNKHKKTMRLAIQHISRGALPTAHSWLKRRTILGFLHRMFFSTKLELHSFYSGLRL